MCTRRANHHPGRLAHAPDDDPKLIPLRLEVCQDADDCVGGIRISTIRVDDEVKPRLLLDCALTGIRNTIGKEIVDIARDALDDAIVVHVDVGWLYHLLTVVNDENFGADLLPAGRGLLWLPEGSDDGVELPSHDARQSSQA